MHHFAFDGVRHAQNGVGVLNASVGKQIAHISGTPGAHGLGLVLLAPGTALGLGGISQRVGRLAPFGRGFGPEITRNTHFARTTVINHIKFKDTGGGGEVGDMLDIACASLAHGGVLAKYQRAHAELAGQLAKEKDVGLIRKSQRVMNHQYMIHAKLFKTTQTLVNAGQRIGIHIALCRFLTVVRAGPAVHERRTRIKQNDDGKRVMPMSEFHHTVDHGLMTQMHAIKCAQRHHGLLVVAERRPGNRAFGVRSQVRDFHKLCGSFIRAFNQVSLYASLREGEYGNRLGLMAIRLLDDGHHIMGLRHDGGGRLMNRALDATPKTQLRSFHGQ